MPKYAYVKGRRINQDELRIFLSKITDYGQFEQDDGTWRSPISGEFFASRKAMVGSFGSYLKDRVPKDVTEPTRRGYIRAIRQGVEPTTEQRAAHAAYMRDHRRKVKHGEVVEDALEQAKSQELPQDREQRLSEERAERIAQRQVDNDAAYQKEQDQHHLGAMVGVHEDHPTEGASLGREETGQQSREEAGQEDRPFWDASG